jgi:hypothetical protein
LHELSAGQFFCHAIVELHFPTPAHYNMPNLCCIFMSAFGWLWLQAQRELGVLYTEQPRCNMVKAAELFEKAAAQLV